MMGGRMSMFAWAARDLRRHGGVGLLTGLSLWALVTVAATILLLVEAWSTTATSIIEAGPSLVVRRVDPGGWRPIPAAAALAAAEGVLGVTDARPRIWGVVTGPGGALTVMGVSTHTAGKLEAAGIAAPEAGEAVIGPGVMDLPVGAELTLVGPVGGSFQVTAILDDALALALHDVVLLGMSDARTLLGLGPDDASDLAVTVFHESEEEAILPDLNAAFPWPVRISTRSEAIGAAVATLARQGGLAMTLLVPSLLAMTLLVAVALRSRSGSRREIGLYKALGWTTGDLLRLHLSMSLAIALPAVLLGLATAWILVFWPGITWPGALLLGWRSAPPPLTLDPGGAAVVLLGVAAMVLLPWLLASIIPAIRSAIADPEDLVRGNG